MIQYAADFSKFVLPTDNHPYMQIPILHRGGIPFYHKKTETEFQKDPYERYDDMVVRQSALHLADEVWGGYPWQAVFDFAENHYPAGPQDILEIGCGVGRWIGHLAQRFPAADCWGIDYSYQMLKRAREFWVAGKGVLFDLSNKGHAPALHVQGHQLSNLQLGVARAESLPFTDESQDLVINSFLLDRLEDPVKGLEEMFRVLKPAGKLIVVTPLNFHRADHWKTCYPPVKLYQLMVNIGYDILDWQEDVRVEEPLDLHGNAVVWKCLALAAQKRS